MIQDEMCEILRRQYGCELTPEKCKGNFIKTTKGKDYLADVCSAIKRITRITWEDEQRRRRNEKRIINRN